MSYPALPKFLRLTPSQRAKAWEGVTLRAVPVFTSASVSRTRNEDAATAAFRAQEEARRKAHTMASISKMKTRIETKKIDHTKMRWNPRLSRFEPDVFQTTKPTTAVKAPVRDSAVRTTGASLAPAVVGNGWSRVTKDTAQRLAKLNSVWDDKYAKLSGGLLVMTVTNRLKGLVKKGGTVKW